MFQLRFRTNYSTECCLVCLTEFALTGMDKQTHIGRVLVNIQKGFDNLDHGVFWKKQNNFGFRTSRIKCFESHLPNRGLLVST